MGGGGQGVLKLKGNLIFNSITMVLPLLPSLLPSLSSLLLPLSSSPPPPPLFLLPLLSSLPHRLDSELELIHTQQTELEDILSGLEEGLRRQPPTAGHHADLERTRTLVCNAMWPNTSQTLFCHHDQTPTVSIHSSHWSKPSEAHTSETALCTCVCKGPTTYRKF